MFLLVRREIAVGELTVTRAHFPPATPIFVHRFYDTDWTRG